MRRADAVLIDGRSLPQRERLETALALRLAAVGGELDAGDAQAEVGMGLGRGDRPGRQSRQARLGSERAARGPIEPQLAPCRDAGVAADELGAGLDRLRRLLPGDELHRVAAPIGAHAFDLAAFAVARLRWPARDR